MINKVNIEGVPCEIQCDICSVVFDDPGEIEEFVCFDYVTGKGSSLRPNEKIKFDVCQDCFQDAFSVYFVKKEDIEFTEELDKAIEAGKEELIFEGAYE